MTCPKLADRALEEQISSIRAKDEHPFHVIKNLFGYGKVRYRGLAKNQAQLFSLFGLANLVLAKRCKGRAAGPVCLEFSLSAGMAG